MQSFVFNTTPSVVFENGAAARLAEIARKTLSDKVLFVTDKVLRELGLCDGALQSLEAAETDVLIFDDVEADPSQATLLTAVEAARAFGATSVVGFGGGSSLDVAKLVALLLGSGEDLDEAWGVAMAKGPRLPLVLIPTTAGTGSEVTPVSIITVSAEEKRGVSSPIILPDVAVLDAELTLNLPPAITAATGVDAMVHAIEAYTSANANNNPLSRMLAKQALQLLGANIHSAVHDGKDVDARSAMLLGSMLAGQAFANSPVAAVHALAYPLGSHFHVPHGLSNALLLSHVMRFNAPEAAETYSEIAADAFPHLADVPEGAERCDAFIAALAQLAKDLGMQTQLREVSVGEADLPKLASDAMKQTRLLVNNPRPVTEADALEIYRSAF